MLNAVDQVAVGANNAPGLEAKPNQNSEERQGVGAGVQETNLLQAPAEHAENGREGNIHAQQTPEVPHGGDFKTGRLGWLLVGLPGRSVGDVKEVDHPVDGRNDAGQSNRSTPIQDGASGQLEAAGEGEEASQGNQSQRGEGGAKVAPTAVDAFSKADFFGREPLRHHADADHEAGTNDGEQQASNHQLVEVLRRCKQQTGDDREDKNARVGLTGTELVQQHANQHAGGNRESDVADRNGTNLTKIKTKIGLNGCR